MTWAELTYRQQILRLRKAALAGVAARGLVGKLEFIQHGENTTYRLKTAEGDFLVRIHRAGYQSTQRIHSELVWLNAMHDAGLRVPQPLPFGRELVQLVQVEGEDEPRRMVLFRWTHGRFRSKIGADTAAEYGRVLGQLHGFVANWEPPSDFDRAQLDIEGLIGDKPVMGGSFELLSDSSLASFESARAEIRRRTEGLGHGKDVFNLIHADLHFRNIVFTPNGAVPIDFDDAGIGYFMFDLAVSISSFNYLNLGPEPAQRLIDEYQRHFETPAHHFELIDTFHALRTMCITLWVLGRQDHPSFRKRAAVQVLSAIEAFDRLL
jgi:Ser/Thr protein kinase RdoA (MazF antagonist)